MTTLFSETFVCPVCSKSFTGKVVGSTNSFGGVETDFRPHAAGTDPLPYYIHQCPFCKFAFISTEMTIPETLKKSILDGSFFDKIEKLSFDEKSSMYLILGFALKEMNSSSEDVAYTFLRASWLARSEKLPEKERYYQLLAIKYFKEALDKNQLGDPKDYYNAVYLIGELYRRIGEFKEALQWFRKVKGRMKIAAIEMSALVLSRDSSPQFFQSTWML